jgi:hypothetical protein
MDTVHEDATSLADLAARWNVYTPGSGALERTGNALRFVNTDTTRRRTSNAQIDDYEELPRRLYRWRPPLTMTVRARFSHPAGQLIGTAGFGFWNDPAMMTGLNWPALPRAIWFFYASPPSDMRLDIETPGQGWKAATIDATRPSALRWAPLAPVVVPLMNIRPLYRWLWPRIQRALAVREAPIDVDMTMWHTYVLHWGVDAVRFAVDDEPVLAYDQSPRGPMGFVMWLDNQSMVVTPWGRFRYRRLDAPGRQWMEVERFSIEMQQGTSETAT